MIDPKEFIKQWRKTFGDIQLASIAPDGPEIMFRWVGWYFKSKKMLLDFPIWIGPFEFKEQAKKAKEEEAAGL